MFLSSTNLQTITKSRILLCHMLHRYIRKYRPHSKALKTPEKAHNLPPLLSGDNYFTLKKAQKCLYIKIKNKKESKENMIEEQKKKSIIPMASKKLNDFEYSWVLTRATSLLDWQGKWCPLIHLSLRKGMCEGESRYQAHCDTAVSSWAWGSTAWPDSIPICVPHTLSLSLPAGMANYCSDSTPVCASSNRGSAEVPSSYHCWTLSLTSLHPCWFEVGSNQDLQERWKAPEAHKDLHFWEPWLINLKALVFALLCQGGWMRQGL